MKIATLQFSPRLGEAAANFSRAESLLMRQEREGELEGIDILVLPELAFTGESKSLLGLFVPDFAGRNTSSIFRGSNVAGISSAQPCQGGS